MRRLPTARARAKAARQDHALMPMALLLGAISLAAVLLTAFG